MTRGVPWPVPTFLMKCPSCGKHFDVERTSNKVESKEVTVSVNKAQEIARDDLGAMNAPGDLPIEGLAEPEDEITGAEEVTQTQTFRCKHCGYTWTESHSKLKS